MVKRELHYMSYAVKRRIIFIVAAIILLLLYIFRDTSFLIRASSAIGSLVLFYLTDHLFDIRFKQRHYYFMTFIAIAGFLLSPLYVIYPNYDKMLHFVLPLLMCSIAFFMISRLKIKLKWQLAFTFFTAIGVLGIFEIGEFLLDKIFDLKLQGVFSWSLASLEKHKLLLDRNDDTMIDLIIGVISSGIYWISMIVINKKHFFIPS